ncbi:MAG TPA: thymidine phosphorylase [Opitutaceae bacterium]|nr:thymidine phosphorylase [Opitutaceae bacterium]
MAKALFPQDVIIAKRDGATLNREQIAFFVRGVVDGSWADYQASALLMAIFLRGMSPQETAWLTAEMTRSGEVLDLSDIPGAKVDKHSTGGVGDKVSLILAPLAAAAGLRVPMMSGRGLGHSGGTLDKLESIPGFNVNLSVSDFRRLVREVGLGMIGQTPTVAPADKKLYALRDVTGTVECIPLICASIMSKKLAEGIDALVLDVKFGSGAFMKTLDRARELARVLVDTGKASGKRVRALLTPMEQPLGHAVGNAVEVVESIECLKGRGSADLMEITMALTAHMLVLGGISRDENDARAKLNSILESGAALAKFREMVVAQDGDARVVDDYGVLPQAQIIEDVVAPANAKGFIATVDALKAGHAAMALGAGRENAQSQVDHAVGITDLVKIGEPIAPGDRLARIHANDPDRLAAARELLLSGIKWAPVAPAIEPLVREVIE